jgi:hypothetical protein
MTQPTYDVIEYRFIDDDGGESAGTFAAAANTQLTQVTGTDNRKRIRIQIQNTNNKSGTEAFDWEYNKEGGGWTPIDDTASSNIRAIGSANSTWTLTDGDDCTTNRLTSQGGSYDSTNSGWSDTGSGTGDTFNANGYWEVELCYYIVDADVADGNEILLRVVENSGDTTVMSVTPDIDVSKPTLVTDNQPAYMAGTDTASDNQSAYVKGSLTANDNQPAYINGTDCPVVDIQSGAGRMKSCSQANSYARIIANTSLEDVVETLLKFQWDNNTAKAVFRVFIRASEDWDSSVTPTRAYEVLVNNNGGYTVNRITTGSRTQIGTGAWTADTNAWWIRFRASGNDDIRFKLWADSGSEPAAWDEEIDDSVSGFTDAGVLQLSLDTETAGVEHTVTLDDISYHSPVETDNQPAYLEGATAGTPASDSQPAYLAGSLAAADSQASYMAGGINVADNQAAYMAGGVNVVDNQTAYMTGGVNVTDSQSAYTEGLYLPLPVTEPWTGSNDDPWRLSHWATDIVTAVPASRLELFLDTVNIESLATASLSINGPTKDINNPLFASGTNNDTWDYQKIYVSPHLIDGIYHFWYASAEFESPNEDRPCFATSRNGITALSKPELGFVVYGGDGGANNILMDAVNIMTDVYHDPGAASDRRFVAVKEKDSGTNGVFVYISPDGYTWSLEKTVVSGGLTKEAKSIVKRPDGRWYVYYTSGHGTDNRIIQAYLSDTDDLGGTWTNLGTVIGAGGSTNQKYALGCQYINGYYVGWLTNYNSTPETAHIDLYVSRDGENWALIDDQWIPLGSGGSWDDSLIFIGQRLLKDGNDWHFYYCGSPVTHDTARPKDMRIGRATIDYQRIGQVGTTGNFITTAFETGEAATLYINTDASGGTLEVEVLDASDDSVMTGYAQADFDDITTDEFQIEGTWSTGSPIPPNSSVKLKFYLTTDVKVYGYEVSPVSGSPGTNNLSSWWPLESDGTDSHGSSNLTEAASPVYVPGKISNAVDLELGSSQYLWIADNASLSAGDTDFTIGCWVKQETKTAVADRIISKRQSTTNCCYDLYYGGTGNDYFRLTIYSSGGTQRVVNASTFGSPSIGTWHFVVAWHDSTANTINIQVNNGTVDSLATTGVTPHDSTATFMIGNLQQVARYWDGLVDEAFFYRKVLTPSQRSWLYNNGAGRSYDEL